MTWSAQREMLPWTICVLAACWFILKHAFPSLIYVFCICLKNPRSHELEMHYFELRTSTLKFIYRSSIYCLIFIKKTF